MRFNHLFKLLRRHNLLFKPFLLKSNYSRPEISNICLIKKKYFSTNVCFKKKFTEEDDNFYNEIDPELNFLENSGHEIDQGYARDLLYKNTRDVLLLRIYNCVSIQELFNVINNNLDQLKCEHLVMSVLVLHDLKNIYHEINGRNAKLSSEFLTQLKDHKEFQNLLKLIEKKTNFFSNEQLSFLLLYLSKLGSPIEAFRHKLEHKLKKKFKINDAARFVEANFMEHSLKSYFQTQHLIPEIFSEIDTCSSLEDFSDLTLCLNKLHNVVTDGTLDKYLSKLDSLITHKNITGANYKLILRIISFLKYPKWRDKNTVTISRCILLIRNNLNKLTVTELLVLYDVFFKTQEPGAILSELQRCSSKFIQQLDDTMISEKITLFSSLTFFSSPTIRTHFQKIIRDYVEKSDDLDDLLNLRKIMSYLKISDVQLCRRYWDKILKLCTESNQSLNKNILKLAQNYVNFNIDLDNYRHSDFEGEILRHLEKAARSYYGVFPQKISSILSFALIYSNDHKFLDYLVRKLEKNWQQFGHVDCLRLSLSLRIFKDTDNKYKKSVFANRIDKVLDRIIEKESETSEQHLWKNNALVKTCIYKNNINISILNGFLTNYKKFTYVSSKHLENMSFALLSTNSLIPELIDRATKYITENRENILGFNVEKILYLCYWFGYQPENSELFFKTATDIIIRDQERMGGLSIVHCALALSFFNKLPSYLIKSIFNVEFLDKIDLELQNCYSKDKYPQRVRHNLMQLNRAVCLDYPESGVPWFHKKFVEEITKSNFRRTKVFPSRVKDYLMKTVKAPDAVLENVLTPYGYNIDFVINLDEQGEVTSDSSRASKKLAILLIPQYAFTRFFVQLRGRYQLKNRHLEILGYKVVMIDFSDWITLFYEQDRIEFLSNLVFPKKLNNYNEVTAR